MDLLHEVAASAKSVTIGGKDWQLSPMRAKHWGEASRRLSDSRRSPLSIIRKHLKGLDSESKKHLIDAAWRDERDGDLLDEMYVRRWFQTDEGAVFRFWKQISRLHPEVTEEMAEDLLRQWMAETTAAKAAEVLQQNEGLPEGNSSGQTQPSDPAASESLSPGVVCSAS